MGADSIRYTYMSVPNTGDVRFGYGIADESRRKLLVLEYLHIL